MTWWAEQTARRGRIRPTLLHVATDVGRGPVVILVHGIASSSITFDEVVPLLQTNHRVIAVDISEFEKREGCVTCLSVRIR